jgi:hypothetical protein
MEKTAIELIEEKVKFEIDIVKMDYNNGVQISMSVFSGMLKKILIEIQQAKEMEKQQRQKDFKAGNDSACMEHENIGDYFKQYIKSE